MRLGLLFCIGDVVDGVFLGCFVYDLFVFGGIFDEVFDMEEM